MHRRLRNWMVDRLPDGLLNSPFEWLVAFMCLFSGFLSVVAGAESASVESLLPEVIFRIWGVLLLIGGASLLIGIASSKQIGSMLVITRVAIYRLGLRLLALSTFVYCVCLAVYAGLGGVAAATLPVAFILACIIRLVNLGDDRDGH